MKMQKFYEDTLITRSLKNLLESEYIPNIDIAEDGDILIEGFFYILDYYIIKCVQTGRFKYDVNQIGLFPSDTVYPSVINYPGLGEIPAKYRVISYIDENDRSYMKKYISESNFYDSKTHKYLGDYLRYYQLKNKVQVMPFYNCCNFQPIYNFHLLSKKSNDQYYTQNSNDDYKIVLAPIKFNKKYTIALSCDSEVLIHAIIYNDKTGRLIKKNSTQYYTDDLKSSFKRLAKSSFESPFIYSIEITDKNLYSMKNNLFLAIQIPKNNNSSISVIEGDYTKDSYIEAHNEITNVIKPTLKNNYSLLKVDSKITYAFSHRLIEYLSNNIIHKNTDITGNISKIQNYLRSINSDYDKKIKNGTYRLGYWDDQIDVLISSIISEKKNTFLVDMNLDINKDVEIIFSEGGKY